MKIQYLTCADASRVLGVTPATVRQMVQRRKLRVAAKTFSGIHLFDPDDVEGLERRRAARKKRVSGGPR